MATKFDLSTLKLPAGMHGISVKARANGYFDSYASAVLPYEAEEPYITRFAIDGTAFETAKDTYWYEWVESERNTDGWTVVNVVDTDYYVIYRRNEYGEEFVLYDDENEVYVLASDYIQDKGYVSMPLSNEAISIKLD